MKLECLILNIVPYGPKDDKGIGMNSIIQFIPYKTAPKDTEKSKGYFISYDVLYESNNMCLFQKISVDDILRPCVITIEPTLSPTGKVTKKIVDLKFN